MEIIILSIIQGITEFLPISSSGHLILFSNFFPFAQQGLATDVAVHFGSAIAILIYFHRYIWQMICSLIRSKLLPNFKDFGNRLAYLLVVGTLPIVIFGYIFLNTGLDDVRNIKIVGWMLCIFAIILYVADKSCMTIKKLEHITFLDALFIGIAQCISLIPGTSRSGVTIIASRLLGLERKAAAQFSMLLAIPAILGATFLVGYELYDMGHFADLISSLDAVAYSFIASIFAIYILIWWVSKYTFLPFVIYRLALGITLLLHSYGYINLKALF
jgi:undecaprenyl-diphosphatase